MLKLFLAITATFSVVISLSIFTSIEHESDASRATASALDEVQVETKQLEKEEIAK